VDWRKALDNNEYIAAILMDLSKAFDCLPHDILLSKLNEYGLSEPATSFIQSYLTNRKQQIKVGNIVSSWAGIGKGVPQGSILGPLLFNVFINIFYFIQKSSLYNYADDNTLSFHSPDFNEVITVLQNESNILIDWFRINKMQANPDKFQAIAVGKKSFSKNPIFKIGDSSITCDETVKLLGIDIDYKLNFEDHIGNICKKAGRQLNILKRIGNHLNKLNKLTVFIPLYYQISIFAQLLGISVLKTIQRKWKDGKKRHLDLFTMIFLHLTMICFKKLKFHLSILEECVLWLLKPTKF